MRPRINQCEDCGAGLNVICLRESDPEGLCPVADKAPQLMFENQEAVSIYYQARETADRVEAKNKFYFYVRPHDVQALMEVFEIDSNDKRKIFKRVKLLQDIDNLLRPARPRRK